jgi:hypothetical protein
MHYRWLEKPMLGSVCLAVEELKQAFSFTNNEAWFQNSRTKEWFIQHFLMMPGFENGNQRSQSSAIFEQIVVSFSFIKKFFGLHLTYSESSFIERR